MTRRKMDGRTGRLQVKSPKPGCLVRTVRRWRAREQLGIQSNVQLPKKIEEIIQLFDSPLGALQRRVIRANELFLP